MKFFYRIAVIVVVFSIIFYLTGNQVVENKPLKSPVKQGAAVPVENKGVGSAIPQTSRPVEGLSIYVGEHVDKIIEAYGKPERIEPSQYDYQWWIYKSNQYFMIGVTEEGLINQLYTPDENLNITPFEMNQSIEDIYRFAIFGAEIDVDLGENSYTFSLNNKDLQSRPVIIYKDLFAQLYIDEIDGILKGVRFIDPKTLILHQPYEMMYMGELLTSTTPSSIRQLEVNETIRRQIFELTNIFREQNDLTLLQKTYKLNQFAQENSKQLAFENISEEHEKTHDNLSKRLKDAEIEHKKAEENTAFDYHDAIEAVHGWLNSPTHRKTLLTKDFTHVGTGVYSSYFTQTFIKSTIEDQRKPYE